MSEHLDRHLSPAGEIFDAGPDVSDRRRLFARHELACRASGVVKLHPGFADHLAWLRLSLGQPMVVTSCCRSAAHNQAVGGNARSLHVYDHPAHGAAGTCALDVRRGTAGYNMTLLRLAVEKGWSVGVARSFFHLDRRVDLGLAQNVFGY